MVPEACRERVSDVSWDKAIPEAMDGDQESKCSGNVDGGVIVPPVMVVVGTQRQVQWCIVADGMM